MQIVRRLLVVVGTCLLIAGGDFGGMVVSRSEARISFGVSPPTIAAPRSNRLGSPCRWSEGSLQGAFTRLARGFFRVFGLVKITVLLGFTIAAYSLDRVRSFRAKRAEQTQQPKTRARRRLGIWSHCMLAEPESPQDDTEGPPG